MRIVETDKKIQKGQKREKERKKIKRELEPLQQQKDQVLGSYKLTLTIHHLNPR